MEVSESYRTAPADSWRSDSAPPRKASTAAATPRKARRITNTRRPDSGLATPSTGTSPPLPPAFSKAGYRPARGASYKLGVVNGEIALVAPEDSGCFARLLQLSSDNSLYFDFEHAAFGMNDNGIVKQKKGYPNTSHKASSDKKPTRRFFYQFLASKQLIKEGYAIAHHWQTWSGVQSQRAITEVIRDCNKHFHDIDLRNVSLSKRPLLTRTLGGDLHAVTNFTVNGLTCEYAFDTGSTPRQRLIPNPILEQFRPELLQQIEPWLRKMRSDLCDDYIKWLCGPLRIPRPKLISL